MRAKETSASVLFTGFSTELNDRGEGVDYRFINL